MEKRLVNTRVNVLFRLPLLYYLPIVGPIVRRLLARFAGALVLSLLAGLWLLQSWMVDATPPVMPPAVLPVASEAIPDEAIRFRVLANSNTVADQWVKRQVRDAVFMQIESWVEDAEDVQAVRQVIGERLGEIKTTADRVLEENGFPYRSKVDFGQVPFPEKAFGDRLYPAGLYEALRITLGRGQGDNFWCVMFPPLCFGTPDHLTGMESESEEADTQPPGQAEHPMAVEHQQAEAKRAQAQVEIRFFLWDWLRGLLG